MFDNYKIALQTFYKTQKDSHKLTSDLEFPNRTKLKQAFLRSFVIKNKKYDTEIIKNFFDPEGLNENQINSIEKVDLDKLRPLVSFLTTGSNLQADAAVHACAWLLDFPPYAEWRKAVPENSSLSEVIFDHKGGPIVKTRDIHSGKKSKVLTILSIVIILCICLGIFWQDMTANKIYHPTANQKCMYWNGDQYIPTICDQNPNIKTTIPINLQTLKSLRRIRWPDLLTKKDIGKVYYARIDGQHEFFTDSGSYPLDPQRRLKPMSTYIWSHHVNFYRFILQSLFWSVILIAVSILLYITIKRLLYNSGNRKATLASIDDESKPTS